jgi:hypothetical protein
MALGTLFGWSLNSWLEDRDRKKVRDFYDGLDELRRHRNRGGF